MCSPYLKQNKNRLTFKTIFEQADTLSWTLCTFLHLLFWLMKFLVGLRRSQLGTFQRRQLVSWLLPCFSTGFTFSQQKKLNLTTDRAPSSFRIDWLSFKKLFSPKLKTNLYRELLQHLPAGAICVKMPTLKMTAIAWSVFIHCFQSKIGFAITATNFES